MKIYLATPYSHPDTSVRESRFRAVNRVAGKLMEDGHIVYSPISHTHPIAEVCNLPKGWDYWKAVDVEFIHWADEIWVYQSPGWEQSKGVQAEIEIAKELGKPVKYI